MAEKIEVRGGRFWNPWRIAGWGMAAFLLLLPGVAMQFTGEVEWDETDFLVMGALIGGVGLAIEFLVRQSDSLAYRLGAVVALIVVFLTLWANLAVGMVGSEDNPHNLFFFGLVLAVLAGAVIARFRAGGMAIVSAVAGIAQAAGAAAGFSTDPVGAFFSLLSAAPWLLAAALFRSAARERGEAGLRPR